MPDKDRRDQRLRSMKRLRLTAGYTALILSAIALLLVAFYIVLPYVPTYSFGSAMPPGAHARAASRKEIIGALVRVAIESKILIILAYVIGVILALLLTVSIAARHSRLPQSSARLRLTASYALFLVAAGGVLLVGIYIVLRYIPNYPMIPPDRAQLRPYITSRSDILGALVRVSGIILVVLAIVGIVGGWFLAGWILRPLRRINEAAQIAATGRLDHRIRLAGRNDEFRQLADTFDNMLDRLHDAFTVQERFAANASHELRTPLTVNATLLDVARRNPAEQDYETLIERLMITNARAIGLTEALLRLADANSIMASSEPIDLSTIARDAIDDSAGEAEPHRIRIDAHLSPAPTMGDATLLRQLTTNLVLNAIRHNSSLGYARIETDFDPLRSVVRLRVENSGRRYTPEQVATFTEPFLRGDGRISRSDHEKGYGLGLALVARIVAVHGGSLVLTPRTEGGLIVVATFRSQPGGPSNETDRIRRRVGPSRARAEMKTLRE
jgi:two-component system sensor histidine kinase VanS